MNIKGDTPSTGEGTGVLLKGDVNEHRFTKYFVRQLDLKGKDRAREFIREFGGVSLNRLMLEGVGLYDSWADIQEATKRCSGSFVPRLALSALRALQVPSDMASNEVLSRDEYDELLMSHVDFSRLSVLIDADEGEAIA